MLKKWPTKVFALAVGRYAIEYDRGYGIDNRNGWTVKRDGSVCCQFVAFRKAAWRLLVLLCSRTNGGVGGKDHGNATEP
jgi:hypothetical protein